MTSFLAFQIFIGSIDINETFTRKELITFIKSQCHQNGDITIDNYRNYATRAGYLEIVSQGKYRKLKEIPDTLVSSELYKAAYPVYPEGHVESLRRYQYRESRNLLTENRYRNDK